MYFFLQSLVIVSQFLFFFWQSQAAAKAVRRHCHHPATKSRASQPASHPPHVACPWRGWRHIHPPGHVARVRETTIHVSVIDSDFAAVYTGRKEKLHK